MTKEEFIEFVQDDLNKQDTVSDLIQTTHPRDIEDMIGIVYAQLVNESKGMSRHQSREDWLASLAVSYTSISVDEITAGAKWTTTLPVVPMSGSASIISVGSCECSDPFKYRTPTEAVLYKYLKSSGPATYQLENLTLKWDKNPGVKTVEVLMIPDFASMESDVEFYLPTGHELVFFDMLKERLIGKRPMPEESKVDHKDDTP